jgi:Kef-type K+ transport system membrane component KefB
MLNFVRAHPYIVSFCIVFLILLFVGVFALDFTWSESIFASAALSVIGVGSFWWKEEGFG